MATKRSLFLFGFAAAALGMLLMSSAALGVVLLLPGSTTPTPPATTSAHSPPTRVISPTPTPLNTLLQADLNTIEGIDAVRVVMVSPFNAGWIVFLELDTQAGYVVQATADAARALTLAHTGTAPLEFSVILWDRQTRAQNYTWDTTHQFWRITEVLNNPG